MKGLLLGLICSILLISLHTNAEQNLQLETTRIKANEELPQILYIVPWKEFESASAQSFKLQLHDLFGDLYEPQLPSGNFPTIKSQTDDQAQSSP